MSVNAVNCAKVNEVPTQVPAQPQDAQKVSFEAKPDEFVHEYKVRATKGKKWGVGIASAVLPGLGQAINGQWGKGIGMALGYGALGFGAKVLWALAFGMEKRLPFVGAIIASLGALGLNICSITDAVKNAKSTVRVVDEEGLKKADK